jgi:hypothetical protein
MQDMAVAMNGGNLEGIDLKGTAIQLGKALNVTAGDTAGATRAMSALQRVGVRFTDDQKKLGAEMIKNNDVMGFQSLILGELETEFGGAAEAAGDTFAGQSAKLKNELGNLGETIGGDLIPVLTDMASWMNKNLIQMQEFSAILAEHRSGVTDTSGTYEDYIAKQDKLREMAGRAKGGIKDLTKEEFLNKQATDLLNDSIDDVKQQFIDASEATEDNTLALEDNEAAAEAAKEEQNRLKEAFSALQTIIDGPVSDAYEDFKTKQDELGEKVELLRAKIFVLEHAEYLTDAQAEELENMQAELGESETALVDLALQHEDTIERMIFGMAAEALARDGWQEGEIEALTALGEKWGIYDEATAAAMRAVESAVSGFNESGNMDTLISDLNNAKNAAEDLSGTYNIDVVTTYKQIGTPSINPGGSFKGGKQHGGPVMAGGMYLVGEAGPELFMPQQSGQIVPNNQISNYFNLTMNTNASQERVVQDFNVMRAMAGA